jgi:predicted nucleic acid-binding Zn ribbon protein
MRTSRGRRRTLATTLADALVGVPGAEAVALRAAFAEACGPRLAREASLRGVTREGRLLVVARTPAWATQVTALAPLLCERVNARVGRPVAHGVDVHVAAD